MKEISIDEKKQIMLDTLSEIDAFCNANGITYFLTGGTLLGAVRHNGYIPWDDDVDICLLRKDYDRLLTEFKSSTGNVEIRTVHNTKGYIWPAAKAVDNRTTLIERGREIKDVGAYIDVFPMDNAPGDYKRARRYVQKVNIAKGALIIKYAKIRKKRAFIKTLIIIIGRVLYLVPTKLLIRNVERLSKKYANEKTEYICNYSGAWELRELTKAEYFSSSPKHVFENKEFNIPIGYDQYLTGVYGDYTTPPPLEKQVPHHDAFVYWK